MRARHEFRTEVDYLEYLHVYFLAISLQGILSCSWGKYGADPFIVDSTEFYAVASDALKISKAAVNKIILTSKKGK